MKTIIKLALFTLITTVTMQSMAMTAPTITMQSRPIQSVPVYAPIVPLKTLTPSQQQEIEQQFEQRQAVICATSANLFKLHGASAANNYLNSLTGLDSLLGQSCVQYGVQSANN